MSGTRFAVSEWSLRRKLALTLAIPLLLATVFGGLRVRSEFTQASDYSASKSQVTVLRPAVDYLAAAERAVVIAREKTAVDDPERDVAVRAVQAAATRLEQARDSAELTPAQTEQVNALLDFSRPLRDGDAYISIAQSVTQVRQLHREVTELITVVVEEQIESDPRLRVLEEALDGRLSLAMQQIQVAYADGENANPVELAAEVGVEAAAIERLGVTLGSTQPLVLSLRQQNAQHFGTVRAGGTDLGGMDAYAAYDEISTDLLDGVDASLAEAAASSRTLVIVNAAITLLALLAAILLALLVSRLLLRPIRKVREGALEVARERLPEVVARIRAGKHPGEITPIDVTTREEIGQLARAVDDLHRQAVVLASGEAELRTQVGEMFVTLSRRHASLINSQLGLIETLERDEEDPQRLESLFRLDHLASRMRRTAESLMILADAPRSAGAAQALTVADAMQAAIAGVQDYQRVQFLSAPDELISPSAAADVVHLLTELVDNALSYSPPTAPVLVMTDSSRHETVVRIIDSGLGIAEEALPQVNADLRTGGEVNADTTRRMGLLVVSRLAVRHGMDVELEHNERGGTTARVTLPAAMLTPAPEPDRAPAPASPDLKPVPDLADAEPAPDAGSQAEGTAAPSPAATPAGEVDRIEAAISAVIGLPQRRPGATDLTGPGAPTAPGESLLQRWQDSRHDGPGTNGSTPEAPTLPQRQAVTAAGPDPAEDDGLDRAEDETPEQAADDAPEPAEAEGYT
ncbi:MAG: ATP-binding protein, partial [Nocardioides sp.]